MEKTLADIDRLIDFYEAKEGVGKYNVLEALYEQRERLTRPSLWQRIRKALGFK